MDETILLVGQGMLAVLVGFTVEGFKRAGMPARYGMLASAGCGVALGVLAAALGLTSYPVGVFGGLMAGAVASGFYSGGKSMMAK